MCHMRNHGNTDMSSLSGESGYWGNAVWETGLVFASHWFD